MRVRSSIHIKRGQFNPKQFWMVFFNVFTNVGDISRFKFKKKSDFCVF